MPTKRTLNPRRIKYVIDVMVDGGDGAEKHIKKDVWIFIKMAATKQQQQKKDIKKLHTWKI